MSSNKQGGQGTQKSGQKPIQQDEQNAPKPGQQPDKSGQGRQDTPGQNRPGGDKQNR